MADGAPIRTFGVKVKGFPEQLYSARSPGKARAQAWRNYADAYDVTFRQFLGISTVRRAADPPAANQRVLVLGTPATTVLASGGNYIAFMRDDSDTIFYAHPSDVTPMPAGEPASRPEGRMEHKNG